MTEEKKNSTNPCFILVIVEKKSHLGKIKLTHIYIISFDNIFKLVYNFQYLIILF